MSIAELKLNYTGCNTELSNKSSELIYRKKSLQECRKDILKCSSRLEYDGKIQEQLGENSKGEILIGKS